MGDAPLNIARGFARRGWAVLPIPHRQKRPNLKGWQHLRLGEDDLARYFNGRPQNFGVLLGEPSGWLIDVDLDHPRAVTLARAYLPGTEAVFGREGKPASHYLYRVTASIDTAKFQTAGREMLVELRSTGCQTVVPGSTHPSGEVVRWDADGEPALVDPADLLDAVRRLAEDVAEQIGEPLKEQKPRPTPKPVRMSQQAGNVDRAWRYIAKLPEAVSGQGGHNATYRAACEAFRFGLSESEARQLLDRFNAEKCTPTWSARELDHKLADARAQVEAAGKVGSRLGRPRSASKPAEPKPAPAFDGPFGLKLTAIDARTVGASGKVVVRFAATLDGETRAPMTITTAVSGAKDAARDLANLVAVHRGDESLGKAEHVALQQFVAGMMATAREIAEHFKQERAERPRQTPTGPTIQSIVIREAPRLAGLTFVNHDGSAWSEVLGRDIDGREFEKHIPMALAEACEQAIDYPEQRRGLSAPIGTIRPYLLMAWSEALTALPGEVKAGTGPDSAAARRYAQAIARLWTIKERWQMTFQRDHSERGMDSATLAQLARMRIDIQAIDKTSGWFRVHNNAIDAWACTTPRLGEDGLPTGEPPDAWLGFRYELVNQLPKHSRPDLPNTRGMMDLGIIARRYGLTADSDPSAPKAMVKEKGRQRRIIVLNRQLTDQILWQWDEGCEPE